MNIFTLLYNALGDLTSGAGQMFVARAEVWLRVLAGLILFVKIVQWTLHGNALSGFLHYVFQLGAATFMLHYWATPIPAVGVSFGQLIPHEMTTLSAYIDATAMNEAQQSFKDAYDALQANTPTISLGLSLSDALVWGVAIGYMWISQALMFAINIVSFLALGMGVFLGPLFIPWMMWPKWSFLTTSLFVYIIEFSMWRLVATALTYVFAKAWVLFFTKFMHGQYTILEFSTIMTGFLILGVAQVWSFFIIPHYVTNMVKGGATAGSNFAGGIAVAVRALA